MYILFKYICVAYSVPLERIGTENNIYQYSSRYKRDLEMSYIEFSSFRIIIKCVYILDEEEVDNNNIILGLHCIKSVYRLVSACVT